MRTVKRLPWIIPEMCVGCGNCEDACRLRIIRLVRVGERKNYVPRIENPEACVGCGMCARKCSYGALMMTTYVDDAFQRLKKQQKE